MSNQFLKFLYSFPVILIFLYFFPFLGVCLLLVRYCMISSKKRMLTSILLIGIGILMFFPKILENIFNILKFDFSVLLYFDSIIKADVYSSEFIKYSKWLITIGVLFLILSALLKRLSNKFQNSIQSYIQFQEKKDYEISQRNDLVMKEKRQKAENTKVVYCPYCGADNLLTSKTGICKYCRRQIITKESERK